MKRISTFGGHLLVMSRDDFEHHITEQTTKRANLIKSNKLII
jgi:hypothetical protein